MELVTYGWIISCILAPLISAICIVVLFLFNVYKGHWRNVDHFLIGLTVQEILSAILCFSLSILNLLHNRNEQLCGLITSLWFAIRILQLATLTSLAIDRLLILKWPYKYRFTVRSFQIKIHLVVLSLCCSSVAVFAYLARLDQTAIQTIINDLPTSSNSLTPNLAYFDLITNPLFGSNSTFNNFIASTTLNSNLDLTTPLSLNGNDTGRANDKLALPLKLTNNNYQSSFLSSASLSSSLINSQQHSSPIYSSTSHIASSLPPPSIASSTNLPSSTISMSQHNLFNKQFSVCSLHPLFWQRTFNIILLGLFALLTLVTIICFIYVDCVRRCSQKCRLIKHANYLSTSSSYLNKNKNKLTGVSILNNANVYDFNRFSNNQLIKTAANNQLISRSSNNLIQRMNSSPGNTTTTTTCTSDNTHLNNQHSSNNKSSLNAATSLSTIAIGDSDLANGQNANDRLNQYDQTNDSLSALCSIDNDLTRSTDALASKDFKNDKKSKMNLLSKSQPSLLHNLQDGQKDSSLYKSNMSVCSFDVELKKKRQASRSNDLNSQKLNLINNQITNQFKYSNHHLHHHHNHNQFKNRLPVRSSSMITQINHHLIDDNEPFSMQSREDLFSWKYLRDHYKVCDLRWSSVVTCTSLCYSVNHLPTMVSFGFKFFIFKIIFII